MWIKVNDKKMLTWENLTIGVICVILTIVGLIAACLSFLQALKLVTL
jgi:hypothetical protein